MVGDLDEEFHDHALSERTLFGARMWYRLQVIKSLGPTLLQRARRAKDDHHTRKTGDGIMQAFLHDLRYTLRGVRKSPAFASLVVLTLALGIGANTIIYSVVDGLILHPYPFPDADRLIVVELLAGRDFERVLSSGQGPIEIALFKAVPPYGIDERQRSNQIAILQRQCSGDVPTHGLTDDMERAATLLAQHVGDDVRHFFRSIGERFGTCCGSVAGEIRNNQTSLFAECIDQAKIH